MAMEASNKFDAGRSVRSFFPMSWADRKEADIAQDTVGTRKTWQHAKRESSGTMLDAVPDYIVNYIRGETPQSVANKRETRRTRNDSSNRSRAGIFLESDAATARHVDDAGHRLEDQGIQHEETGDDGDDAAGQLTSGWRGGVAMNGIVGVFVIFATVLLFVVAISRARSGETRIFEGSCSTSLKIHFGGNIVINLFILALLMGVNYAFQVLTSPTRAELDKAHDAKRWLDIGIPSLRNVRSIAKRRVVLAIIIMAMGMAMQVLYNAVIFTTMLVPSHDILVVDADFLDGAEFSEKGEVEDDARLDREGILELQESAGNKELSNLTMNECIQLFDGKFQSKYDAVLLIVEADSERSDSLLHIAPSSGVPLSEEIELSSSSASFGNSKITSCLARPSKSLPHCALDTNDVILGEAILIAILTVVPALALLCSKSYRPLTTLGDAIASFVTKPDSHTQDASLITKSEIRQGRWSLNDNTDELSSRRSASSRHWWLQVPTISRWAFWFLTWATPTAISAAFLGILLKKGTPLQNPFNILPFSAPQLAAGPPTYLTFPNSTTHASLSMVSAVPHLLMAVLYLTTNALLSTFFLSHEFSQYYTLSGKNRTSASPRPLRVSSQKLEGDQVNSLFLTLPRPYSWALLVLFVPMSVFLSFTLHPVIVASTAMSSEGRQTTTREVRALLADPLPLIVVLAFLACILGLVVVLSLRQETRGNPLGLKGGSCSAVIAARCRALPEEKDIATGLVSWGVIRAGRGGGGEIEEASSQDKSDCAVHEHDSELLGFSALGLAEKVDLEQGGA